MGLDIFFHEEQGRLTSRLHRLNVKFSLALLVIPIRRRTERDLTIATHGVTDLKASIADARPLCALCAIGMTICGWRSDSRLSSGLAQRLSGMSDHVYKKLELVGSSKKSFDDAVKNALSRASKTMRNMRWFEVIETRGYIEKNKIDHWQVTVKIGFTLE
jgi:hypothetical protein